MTGPINRLARESSPYLLQHSRNPVDWYAWGPEAFAAARALDRPIFLSVGYSTCYWCHVMERQSFENVDVARVMNELFINIKVDREERPDIDQIYMTAVQVLTRQGGWPMSVWLTPDLRPFHGGTYFPPDDQSGRPGFTRICRSIADAYQTRRGDVDKAAAHLVNVLQRLASPRGPEQPVMFDRAFVDDLVRRSASDFDPANGGFGSAPKFPRETLIELLLRSDEKDLSGMAQRSLDAMADGGIRDHLGGGFHRYSTDEKWLVPHFEIMLYDNALLGTCYVEAYARTTERRYATVARGIFDFVLREMTSENGTFYTALDAEVDGQEGLNYLWVSGEVVTLLGPDDAKFFNKIYGLSTGPNFVDPHHGGGVKDKNILHLPRPLRDVAVDLGTTEDELDERLKPLRQKLYDARMRRKQPLLDRKILTSWNALMIRALARAGEVLDEPRYSSAAINAANALLRHHRTPDGNLVRSSGGGLPGVESTSTPVGPTVDPSPIVGTLDDYAFFARALLQLHQSDGQEIWKDHAAGVVMKMIEAFADDEAGGFYFTSKDAADLIVRQKTASDSPLPSGNATAVQCLLELGLVDRARLTLAAFAQTLVDQAEGMSSLLDAAVSYVQNHPSFTVTDAPDDDAPDRPTALEKQAEQVVGLSVEIVDDTTLLVNVEIDPAYHLYAPSGAPDPNLKPVKVTVTGIELASIDYPAAEVRRFAFVDEPIAVYEDRVTITLKTKSPVSPGQRISVGLEFQACTDDACLPAARVETQVRVEG